jgi:hypothetical protein
MMWMRRYSEHVPLSPACLSWAMDVERSHVETALESLDGLARTTYRGRDIWCLTEHAASWERASRIDERHARHIGRRWRAA